MFKETSEGQTNFCLICESYACKIIAKDKQIAFYEKELKGKEAVVIALQKALEHNNKLLLSRDEDILKLKKKLQKDYLTAYVAGKQEGINVIDKIAEEWHGGGNGRRLLILAKDKLQSKNK